MSLLALALPAFAQKQLDSQPAPLSSAEAAAQGQALVREILSQRPTQNYTNTGSLKIRDANGKRTEFPVKCEILVTPTNWLNRYEAALGKNTSTELKVIHPDSSTNQYAVTEYKGEMYFRRDLSGNQIMVPFAGSDFWLADLGLEFFHWPEQRILKSELRKSRACKVLESVNPQPVTNGYSRVVSWIDVETDGIIHAEAYDSRNQLLKEFDTKKFKKVKGEWQLEEMQISNVQTDSRSQIEFSFDSK